MAKKSLTLLKFGIISFLNLGVDLLAFTFLSFCGLPYLYAQCLSYCCGLMNSHTLNKLWATQLNKKTNQSEWIRFTGVNVITLIFVSGLLFFLFQITGWPLFLSKLCASSVGVIINYLGAHLFVFQVSEMEREEF